MARTIGWLPRLSTLRHTVERSRHTHYGRRDFEQLFELQPRAANLLITLLPSVQVGSSSLVEQPVLARFLARLDQSPDPAAEIRKLERAKARRGRLTLRALVEDGIAPRTLNALPEYVTLETGRVTIDCTTVEQLTAALYAFANLLDHDLNTLTDAIEGSAARTAAPSAIEDKDAAAVREMFGVLNEMEAEEHSASVQD